jgi:hypothetical protein
MRLFHEIRLVAQTVLKETRLPVELEMGCLVSFPTVDGFLDTTEEVERGDHVQVVWHDQHEPDKPTSHAFVAVGTLQETIRDVSLEQGSAISHTAIDGDEMAQPRVECHEEVCAVAGMVLLSFPA